MKSILVSKETGTRALWVSDEELEGKMDIEDGGAVFCSVCSTIHRVNGSLNPETGEKTDIVLYVKHNDGRLLMVGARGKYIGDLPIVEAS